MDESEGTGFQAWEREKLDDIDHDTDAIIEMLGGEMWMRRRPISPLKRPMTGRRGTMPYQLSEKGPKSRKTPVKPL